jgi:uncharacterized membrane protein
LTQLSLKNGEIDKLKMDISAERQEKEKYKAASRKRIIIVFALIGSWILFIGFKTYLFFTKKV